MEVFLALVLLLLVAAFIAAPLRSRPGPDSGGELARKERQARLAELEARKEVKYREIRDAELDHAVGKLSEEDFRRQNAELRRDAVEILDQIDALRRPGQSADD